MLRIHFLRALLAAAIVVLGATAARAQTTGDQPKDATPPAEAPSPIAKTPEASAADERLAHAKELFRTGNGFLRNRDFQRALELFLKSRETVPSYQNTVNAAICLEKLGRYDEALELYEAALIEFPNDITPELRASLEPKLAELRERVGSIDISANVNGAVVVDGRERGKLPLPGPVRALPGERSVRVIKDGYETFEKRVKVTLKETVRVDATLKPLASAGRLRVEVPEGDGAELRVDGAVVGKVPWEGTLAPGNHVYEIIREDAGTGPQRVTILQGQMALVRVTLKPLSRTLRFIVTPPTAKLTLDELPIDAAWQGRLTVGKHQLSAREEGYFDGTQELDVTPTTSGDVTLDLKVNGDHPRWTKAIPSKIWLEAFGGYAITPSLGSRAEECTDLPCSAKQLGHGPIVGIRGAYELPIRVSLELAAGYVSLSNALRRSTQRPFNEEDDTTPVTYELLDQIRLRGVVVTAGVGFHQPLGNVFGLQARIHLGALINKASDTITGDASSPVHGSAPIVVEQSGAEKQSVAFVIEPEVQALLRLGHFRAGATLGALIVPLPGPNNDHGDMYPKLTGKCGVLDPMPYPVGCTGNSDAVKNERLYGPFAAFTPGLSAGYEF